MIPATFWRAECREPICRSLFEDDLLGQVARGVEAARVSVEGVFALCASHPLEIQHRRASEFQDGVALSDVTCSLQARCQLACRTSERQNSERYVIVGILHVLSLRLARARKFSSTMRVDRHAGRDCADHLDQSVGLVDKVQVAVAWPS